MRSTNGVGAPIGVGARGRSGRHLLDESIAESEPKQTMTWLAGGRATSTARYKPKKIVPGKAVNR